jgi:peptidoglycan/xylan/chitin deacetylase (PgdA/CDA1 family)
MYHYISTPPEDADEYRVDLSVTPQNFRAQMQYLVDNGYTAVDLYKLSLAITDKERLPERPVIITFDDGYTDHYTNAFPVLQEFGLVGTFFVITDFADNGVPGYMNWDMIEEMAAAGMRIESHSRTHADLRERGRDFLVWQMLGSQQTLAAHIGYMPRYFGYPGGRYDEETIAALKDLDFWGAVTTAFGKAHDFDDRYEWARVRMRYTTTLPLFADFVAPAG